MITKTVNNVSLYRVLIRILRTLLVSRVITRHYNGHERSTFEHQKTERTPHVRSAYFTFIIELKSKVTGHANVRCVRPIFVSVLKSPHCAYVHKYVNKGLTNTANRPKLRSTCLLGPSWHIELIAVIKCKKSANFLAKNRCPVGADLMI